MLVDRLRYAVRWIDHRIKLTRWAWCELTGGHELATWGAFMRRDTDLASKIRTECSRYGKGTPWIDTPTRGPTPSPEDSAEDRT